MMDLLRKSFRRAAAPAPPLPALAALALVAVLPASAQSPGDSTLPGFVRIGDYLLEVDGDGAPDGEVYFSNQARAYLVLSARLVAPALLWPTSGAVETVNLMKVNKKTDGTVDILPNARLAQAASFEVSEGGTEIRFTVEGRQAVLKAKPPLLGDQSRDTLAAYSPEYARAAEAYSPSPPIVGELRAVSDEVRVEVYFGSWCGACKQMVPRIMRVDRELDGSRIRVGYYGLPRGISEDAQARAKGITAVPTGVVYVDGREIGRIRGSDWKIPELAIKTLLDGTG